MTISYISSKAAGPILTKFHVEPSGVEGTQKFSNSLGHFTNMAAMPING